MPVVTQSLRSASADTAKAWREVESTARRNKDKLCDNMECYVNRLVRISSTNVIGAPSIWGRALHAPSWVRVGNRTGLYPIIGFVTGYELDGGYAYLLIAELDRQRELKVNIEDVENFDIEILDYSPD